MSFLFPAFLAGLAAFLLPWLLHRFNRETPPETAFPSTRFLEATRVPVSRTKRIRHWSLFLLRGLFLLAACLLFAQPYCSIDSNRDSLEINTFVAIDRSASMQTGDRWDRAVAAASDALSEARQSLPGSSAVNAVQLFDFTSSVTAHGELSTDLAQASSALRGLSPSYERSGYGVVMQQLDALASREELPVRVILITDGQQSSLPLQRRLLRTQHIDQLQIKNISLNESNVSVRASASSLDGINLSVSAQLLLSAGAGEASEGVTKLSVIAGERELFTESLLLSANEVSTRVIDDLVMPGVDLNEVEIRVAADDDGLQADSSITVPVRRLEPVTVGMRALGMKMPEDASLFLRTALTTDEMATVVVPAASDSGLSTQANHWIVFVPQTGDADVSVPTEVSDFVASGGNVLLVLQADIEPSSESNTSDYIGSVDVAHPLGLGELDWQETRVYSSLMLNFTSADRVLMRTGAGHPILVERALDVSLEDPESPGTGRLLILADPLDGVASDIPLQSSFVDWVGQTVGWFDASVAFPAELDAGESLSLPAKAQVLAPDGRALRSLAESGSANRLTLHEPGVHKIVTSLTEHSVSVNVPWEESDLAEVNEAFLSTWANGVLPGGEVADKTDEASNTRPDQNNPLATSETTGRPWWPWLLPILALTLFSESLLANRRLAVRRDGF